MQYVMRGKQKRRLLRNLLVTCVVITLAGCAPEGRRVLTFVAAIPPERNTIESITELVSANSNLQFEIIVASDDRSSIDYVASGEADFAIVPNDTAYVPGVFSSVPVETSLLHMMYAADESPSTIQELLTMGEVFSGPEDNSAFRLTRRMGQLSGLPQGTIAWSEGERPTNESVVILLGPVSPLFERFLENRRLFSLGDPAMLGSGTVAEGLAGRDAQLRPYVIPAFTYGAATPEPVLTLASDTHIVISENVNGFVAFAFTQALVENKAQLGPRRSTLIESIREDFDRTALTFPLHPGVRRFLDRDQPTFLERYAEVVNVTVYIAIILVGAIAASFRWNSRRKKDRADEYYKRVLEVRDRGPFTNEDERAAAARAVRDIYDEAFSKLMDERLAANQSFQILISLCDMTLREIERPTKTN